MIAELDAVALTHDIPTSNLAAGDIGAVVHRYEGGGYEVEFVTGGGETVAVLTLTDTDIRPLQPTDILHARSLRRPK
ncbi:MAG: DUF4926 domain-containing protein [Gemmatimonadetes bacterium]|nr:DUF4926 domain-containing protein [Gemmatimonadota bacterium]